MLSGIQLLGEFEPFFRLLFAIQSHKHYQADSSLMEPIVPHTCAHSKSLSYRVRATWPPFRAGIHPAKGFNGGLTASLTCPLLTLATDTAPTSPAHTWQAKLINDLNTCCRLRLLTGDQLWHSSWLSCCHLLTCLSYLLERPVRSMTCEFYNLPSSRDALGNKSRKSD